MKKLFFLFLSSSFFLSCTDKYKTLVQLDKAPAINLSADTLYLRCHDTTTIAGSLSIFTADENRNLQQITYQDTSYGKLTIYYSQGEAEGVLPIVGDSTKVFIVANEPGTFAVTFTLIDRLGKEDRQKLIVKTRDDGITPSAHLVVSEISHWIYQLDASGSTDPYGYVAHYHFVIDGAEIITSTAVLRHVFYAEGTHSISLYVENDVKVASTTIHQSITIQ